MHRLRSLALLLIEKPANLRRAASRGGKGTANRALSELLGIDPTRPLHAFVAVHNLGSSRRVATAR